MQTHYNAFISYRHHPEDIRVASEIHRLLERFRVPKGLQGKTKKISRLFRDKDELPITSNLTEDITAALRNSDFLIVICSVHTRESIWVQREIETFLQTHARSQVLTVLCSGEPYEVIPEILLREEVTDPVTGEVLLRDVEPLSCDWRLPGKQARREELPRLAAALMGCGYDDLRQRQRHYRMQRLITAMAAAAALSLGFAGYFLYTSITIQRANVQIQANLEEALRNQSRFLSNAAQERLDAGDRLTAIALAMEALPEYDGERPYVPEAEYVLSDALGVYMPEDITAVGAMGRNPGVLLRDFWVSENQPVAVIRDDRGILTTWNTDTMEKIATLPVESSTIRKVIFTEAGTILVQAGTFGEDVYAVTTEGECLWKTALVVDMAYRPDNTLLLLCRNEEQYHLRYVDPETGTECCDRMEVPVLPADKTPGKIMDGGSGTESGVILEYIGWGEHAAAVLLPGSREPMVVLQGIRDVSCSLTTEDGKLLVMAIVDTFGNAGSVLGNRITAPQEYTVFCYDLRDGSLLWNRELMTYFYTGSNMMERIPDSEKVLCICGNTIQVMDLQTGELLSRCEAGSGILAMSTDSEYAMYILEDGYVGLYYFDENESYEMPYMEGNLKRAEICHGMYGLQKDGDQVTLYRTAERERVWSVSNEEYGSIDEKRIRGDLLAFTDYKEQYLFSLSNQTLLWHQDSGYQKVLDFSGDGSRIWAVRSGTELVTYDTEDGHSTAAMFPWELEEEFYSTSFGYGLKDDCLYYLAWNLGGARLVCWDLNTEEIWSVPLPSEISQPGENELWNAEVLGCTDGYAWICLDEQRLYAVDYSDGSAQLILEAEQSPKRICRDGARAVFSVDSRVYIYDGTEQLLALHLEDARGCSAVLREEDLFVLCDNGWVYRFDHSGNRLWETEIDVYNTFATDAASAEEWEFGWYFTEDNRLIVNALGVATVIDCENWGVCAGFPGFLDFDTENNRMLLNYSGVLSGCPLYSTEELLEIAREQLNGYSLSAEERRYYGIE